MTLPAAAGPLPLRSVGTPHACGIHARKGLIKANPSDARVIMRALACYQ